MRDQGTHYMESLCTVETYFKQAGLILVLCHEIIEIHYWTMTGFLRKHSTLDQAVHQYQSVRVTFINLKAQDSNLRS